MDSILKSLSWTGLTGLTGFFLPFPRRKWQNHIAFGERVQTLNQLCGLSVPRIK
jgi:hypothetical protein